MYGKQFVLIYYHLEPYVLIVLVIKSNNACAGNMHFDLGAVPFQGRHLFQACTRSRFYGDSYATFPAKMSMLISLLAREYERSRRGLLVVRGVRCCCSLLFELTLSCPP